MDGRKKQVPWAALRVGLVLTGALAVLFFTVLFAGHIGDLFSSRVTLYAAFKNVKGLRPQAPVWISGLEIGSVRSLQIMPEHIRVTMSIDRDALARIKTDSRTRILTLGLLGDAFVDIIPGSPEAPPVKPGETLRGAAEPGISSQLEGILSQLKGRKGTIGRLLQEDTAYTELVEVLRETKELIEKVETSKGTVNSFLADKSLYKNMNAAAAKLNAVLDKINAGEGTAGSLVNNKELERELQATLKEANALLRDIRANPKKYFKFSLF